jgi:uncharacterized membrane protein YgcG
MRGFVVVVALVAVLGGTSAAIAAGPPFPDPIPNQAVYDYAGAFRADTIASLEETIDIIENRTGAEIVVYTQVKPGADEASTERDAIFLIDAWGIGRAGFDDGMVILFNLDESLVHGQVQLYAAPGFRAAYLSNVERQAIFENDMLPLLREGALNGAVLVALSRIDDAATEGHASRLRIARTIDAVLGLVGGPLAFLLVVGFAIARWWRFGRDPVYLDDPSIHIPAPPPDLTAASAALVRDGWTNRRALTTALLDLASRGRLAFREERVGLLGRGRKVGVELDPPAPDPATDARRARNARRPLADAEVFALAELSGLTVDGVVQPDDMPKFAESVTGFNDRLEKHVVAKRWFAKRPSDVANGWFLGAIGVVVLGLVPGAIGWFLPSGGLVMLGGALVAAGIVVAVIGGWMPAVTMSGAMIRAMLAAYRRTLEKTMIQARSMQQVVDEAQLDWLETPDQAVVWGVALGLHREVEEVLERSIEDVRDGVSRSPAYFPTWYMAVADGSAGGTGGSGGGGLLSSSPIPNVGGMISVLSTIGSPPGGSGGFGGGGSGGGGGGAGGGF